MEKAPDTVQHIRQCLRDSVSVSPAKAAVFFKTAPGHYAEHDQFMGVTVPNLRKIAKLFREESLAVLKELLLSKINEERLLALFILVNQYQKADPPSQQALCAFYVENLIYVNNWNLVDASAHLILGAHLWDKDRSILRELAKSDNLWKRRISIVSTWWFIRKGELDPTFQIASLLLQDNHDLIHKATGWMLREAGKQKEGALLDFLKEHTHEMPRTMLRYAIEKLPATQRSHFLHARPYME
ncbi:MAG: DNA alkylation repair protein [Alphaproteobacteria bacterium]